MGMPCQDANCNDSGVAPDVALADDVVSIISAGGINDCLMMAVKTRGPSFPVGEVRMNFVIFGFLNE
jgi:hypothetical protein